MKYHIYSAKRRAWGCSVKMSGVKMSGVEATGYLDDFYFRREFSASTSYESALTAQKVIDSLANSSCIVVDSDTAQIISVLNS